jgi:DNA-binding response OmpR family regulator
MTNPESTNPTDKLVLIVDDDESVRDLLEFVVKKEGFKIEKAVDGEEALQKARRISPDLILLDLMLPKLGGFEILRELQSDETVNIPIVIITGRYTERSTSEMIKQEPNVKDFIEKPVKPQLLLGILHKLLKTRPPTTGKTGS